MKRLICCVLIVILVHWIVAPCHGKTISIDFETTPDNMSTSSLRGGPVGNVYLPWGVQFDSIDPADTTDPKFSIYLGYTGSTSVVDLSRRSTSTFNIKAEFVTPVQSVSADVYTAADRSMAMIARNASGQVIGTYNSTGTNPFYKGRLTAQGIGAIKSVEWMSSDPVVAASIIDNLQFDIPDPVPPVRIEPTLPPKKEGAKNLVFITHGWNGDMNWVNDMRDSVESHIHQQDLAGQLDESEWEVRAYDWTAFDGNLTTGRKEALVNAITLGVAEGYKLATEHYEHIHFIAHSAGAGLSSSAAHHIKLLAPETRIHETLLDAYAPGKMSEFYGASSTWADHYLNDDFDVDDWKWTDVPLPHAFNVDVTDRDLNPAPFTGHAWPHEFYQKTIEGTFPFAQGYGFPLSLEGGNWDPAQYPVGNEPVMLDPPLSTRVRQLITTNILPVGFSSAETFKGDSGTVLFASNTVELTTGSPVWIAKGFVTSELVNTISFDLDFTSAAGAEGLLAVYFDDVLAGMIDERFAFDGVHEYSFYLGEIDPDAHMLSFRLDPYTSTTSRAEISNVELSLVQIPEPSTVVLFFSGIMALAAYRLKPNQQRQWI